MIAYRWTGETLERVDWCGEFRQTRGARIVVDGVDCFEIDVWVRVTWGMYLDESNGFGRRRRVDMAVYVRQEDDRHNARLRAAVEAKLKALASL